MRTRACGMEALCAFQLDVFVESVCDVRVPCRLPVVSIALWDFPLENVYVMSRARARAGTPR